MSKWIDADYVNAYPIRIDHYDEENGDLNFVLGIESVMEYVSEAPSIDIVFCKECEHSSGEGEYCENDHFVANDDCFCSYGRRKGVMPDMCSDNRFEIIARAKQDLLNGTNIETDEAEMAVIDNILFRCWQMGWLDRYDIADTPQTCSVTEKPYDCKNCKYGRCTADTPQTEDLLITEYPQEGEVNIVGNGSRTAVVMDYDKYKEIHLERSDIYE